MRIGTWNLDRRLLREAHFGLIREAACDVWLLTEVNPKAECPAGRIAGFRCHLSAGVMGRGQHWAAVLSRPHMHPLPDPHPASAAAVVGGWTFCATVLPWRSAGGGAPWVGARHADKTAAAVRDLVGALPRSGLVWGGDWNHSLRGRERAGSVGGRSHVLDALRALNLHAPTADLLARGDGGHAIDHVAVPAAWADAVATRLPAGGLSDHDAYVVEVPNVRLAPEPG